MINSGTAKNNRIKFDIMETFIRFVSPFFAREIKKVDRFDFSFLFFNRMAILRNCRWKPSLFTPLRE